MIVLENVHSKARLKLSLYYFIFLWQCQSSPIKHIIFWTENIYIINWELKKKYVIIHEHIKFVN